MDQASVVPAVPNGRKTQHTPAIKEVNILWLTQGLGCDGDSVSAIFRASCRFRLSR